MKSRLLLLSLLTLLSTTYGQIISNPPFAHFGWILSETLDSITVEMSNESTKDFIAEDVFSSYSEFWTDKTSLNIPALGSASLTIYFKSNQNINYRDYILFQSSTHPRTPSIYVSSEVEYSNSYYDATQDLWDEDLKVALKTAITNGHNALSYNAARDEMYMVIDNKKVNGQGTQGNTLECVYTARLAENYSDRQDAQSNHSFNTEHTFPQGFFNSAAPMKSDLHHIFPTDDASNSQRANKPFGYVSSPSWSQGGSLSDAGTFEPRDIHKSQAAASVLYFVTRYGDYSSFGNSQEPVLRDWMKLFPPDAIDKKRNKDVMTAQGNRNPYIDYPQFLDRIKSLSISGVRDPDAAAHSTSQVIFAPLTEYLYDTGWVYISNTGLGDPLQLSNFSFSDPAFSFIGTPSTSIEKDSIAKYMIQFAPGDGDLIYNANLSCTTNDPLNPSLSITLSASGLESIGSIPQSLSKVFPNPTTGIISVETTGNEDTYYIWDISGKIVQHGKIHTGNQKINLSQYPEGLYFLELGSELNQKHKILLSR